MSQRKYDVVLFDLYGTLVDCHVDESSDDAWTALRNALYREGANYVTNDRLREQFEKAANRELGLCGGQDDLREPDLLGAYEELFSDLWIQAGKDLSGKMAWAFRKAALRKLALYPGALDMLRTLKGQGMRIILLSNAQSCYTRPELEALGLDDIFDDVILSSDEGVRMPSPSIFQYALRAANVPADRVLMVGNDERCDVLGAKAAGIDAVYLDTRGEWIDSHGNVTDVEHITKGDVDDRPAPEAVKSFRGADYRGLLDFILENGTSAVTQQI